MPHRTQGCPPQPTPPARRLIVAGFIRRATGRILTVDATGPRVTGTIRRAVAA
ncbi:hypothetical protein JHN52_01135 [Streptomyces sp. MBT97]|uniref:hypothetical protein n=1 Tax=Streptomyces sp. MBT97 TaxID=2800411 RepID=UPI00190E1E6F|nr:hypothetical protein [Streptomyces sp. MBT97]MBK3631584.1 hypothetical protein [Streptomyces sp. MBT97]